MIKNTTNYDMFKFRNDNREKIIQSRVLELVESIKQRNLLEFVPILVNKDMEVMQGQHRLMAARMLGVEIYYEVNDALTPEDMMKLNNQKSWGMPDYLNFHVKNHYPEYLKLEKFMKEQNVQLKVALNITMGQGKVAYKVFKSGAYVFPESGVVENIDQCWATINYIKKRNGYSSYTESARFWNALIKLVAHTGFNQAKWFANMEKMVERFSPKATTDDYLRMMMDIHNWHNPNKIDLLD